jgi:hypothetical protein
MCTEKLEKNHLGAVDITCELFSEAVKNVLGLFY